MPVYVCDFETTTDINDCRVWACGFYNIENDSFIYGNSINYFFDFCERMNNPKVYFHNLKFDGEFIICELFKRGFKHCENRRECKDKTFTTLITDMGQFYSIEIYFKKAGHKVKKVTILDSLKIIPLKVEEIAKAFNLTIQKEEINYTVIRKIGHILTKKEVSYLKNDCEIVGRALKYFFEQDLKKITQASNALGDYKKITGEKQFNKLFPNPYYDNDIRPAYRGGFTYVNPKYKGKDLKSLSVYDVNSLYPSVMYYKPLPYGNGKFFNGKYEYDELRPLYIQKISCQFELKKGFLPTIQLKGNLSFALNEYVTSSKNELIELVLSSVDLELFLKHYDVYNLEYLSGWKFKASNTLFKKYINKWYSIKEQATKDENKGLRTLSKLMLNALYGKFAVKSSVKNKIPYNDNGICRYKTGQELERDLLYLPIAIFITAYSRYTTITAAQSVIKRFVYADTDSLHLIGTETPAEIEISDTKLGAWKKESTPTRGRFLRQKCYIEEIDNKLNVTCCGMPAPCHKYVNWDNFHEGLKIEKGKLTPCHVVGGIVLKDTDFTIKV